MKSKKGISEYAPWEMENNQKKKPARKGIPPSNQRSKVHSKPKAKDHAYLEMYILAREKERLEKYGTTLGRRLKSIAAIWKNTKSRMYEMQRDSAKTGTEGIEEMIQQEKVKKEGKEKKTAENVKKMNWEY